MKSMEKIKRVLGEITNESFHFLINLVEIVFKIIIIFGSITSMILLFKMFPGTALLIFKPLTMVFKTLFLIFKIVLFIFFLSGYFFIILWVYTEGKEIRKRYLDEVVNELKKRLKKKNARRKNR